MTNRAIPAWAVPGARVVCVNKLGWANSSTGEQCLGPAYNELVTVKATDAIPMRGASVLLKEYAEANFDHGYLVSAFRPAVEPKSEAHDVALFEDIVRGMSLVERLDRIAETLDA